jgi:hypothetical protein
MQTKQCSICKQKRSIEHFWIRKGAVDGRDGRCKICMGTKTPRPPYHICQKGFYWCPKCQKELDKNKFHKARHRKNGLNGYCKTCGGTKNPRHISSAGYKWCPNCKQEIPRKNFYSSTFSKDGLTSWCIFCKRIDGKLRAQKERKKPENKNKRRNSDLKCKFNITLECYNQLLEKQNGTCAICKQPETTFDKRAGKIRALAVDHNHSTNKIRGLLCCKHNHGIGLFNDDPSLLEKAANYLKQS